MLVFNRDFLTFNRLLLTIVLCWIVDVVAFTFSKADERGLFRAHFNFVEAGSSVIMEGLGSLWFFIIIALCVWIGVLWNTIAWLGFTVLNSLSQNWSISHLSVFRLIILLSKRLSVCLKNFLRRLTSKEESGLPLPKCLLHLAIFLHSFTDLLNYLCKSDLRLFRVWK